MVDKNFFKSRLRTKGQVTVPAQIRAVLGAEDGDDLLFHVDELGHVVVSRARVIAPDQAWFWAERWQRLEYEAQADIEAGRIAEAKDLESARTVLDQAKDSETGAED